MGVWKKCEGAGYLFNANANASSYYHCRKRNAMLPHTRYLISLMVV